MGILSDYEQGDGLSICFCLLHHSKKEEEQLFKIQREMSKSSLSIRQCYVFGDQTVNALEFSRFYPGYYTKAGSVQNSYPAHEALVLAAGMMKKEIDQMKKSGGKENRKYLLLIVGEDFAKKQSKENIAAYQTVKQWVLDQKDRFDIKVVD